jgi:hypothetical protein
MTLKNVMPSQIALHLNPLHIHPTLTNPSGKNNLEKHTKTVMNQQKYCSIHFNIRLALE